MQWEYYRLATVETALDDALDELGQDGWELVSILPESRLFHGFQCLLKRPAAPGAPSQKTRPPVPPSYNKYLSVR